MYLKILIKNYYERFGSFEGISDTFLWDCVESTASLNSCSTSDVLYGLLGFTENGFKGSKDRVDEALKLISSGDSKDSEKCKQNGLTLCTSFDMKKFTNLMKCIYTATECNENDKSVLPDKNTNKQMLSNLINFVASYYLTIPTVTIMDGKPLGLYLKNNATRSIKSLLANLDENVIKVKKSTSIVEPTIYNGTLFISKDLSEAQQSKINKGAITIATGRMDNLEKWVKSISSSILLTEQHDEVYKNALLHCAHHGISYSDLAISYGYNVPDFLSLYQSFGQIFYVLHDKACILTRTGWNFKSLESVLQDVMSGASYELEPVKFDGGVLHELSSF